MIVRVMKLFNVLEAEYNWNVPAGFLLDRTDGAFPYWVIAQYFGELELHIEGKEPTETTNTIIILPPCVPHWYICHAPLSHNWLHIQGDFQPMLERYSLESSHLYPLMEMAEISELFHALSRSCYSRDAYRQEFMRLKMEEILVHLATQINKPQEMKEIGHARSNMLRELRNEILEHPDKEWTVQQMAAQLYLSESHFYQLYRQCFGVSPAQDVSIIRANRAKTMLRTGMPVSFVAERCGYSSVYSFIRAFKRVTGTTPGQYRRI